MPKKHSCTNNLIIVDLTGQWVSFCSICRETFVKGCKSWYSLKESEPIGKSTIISMTNVLEIAKCSNPFIVIDNLFEGYLTPHWEDCFFSFLNSLSLEEKINKIVEFCHQQKWKILYLGAGTNEVKNRWSEYSPSCCRIRWKDPIG